LLCKEEKWLSKERKEVKKEKQENQKSDKKLLKKVGTELKKKWLINGTKTLILVLIIIAIYIAVNLLLEKVVLPEIDCTKDKIYSLSQESKDKLANLEQDTNITLINYSNNPAVISFAERYVELNNHIKIEKVDDLSARPDLMQTYSLGATDSLIIVKAGKNEKTLTDNELYTVDYSSYEEIDTTEEAITNAIIDVTEVKKSKIYFMSTHTMYQTEYFSSIIEAMENESNEVEMLDILAKGGIPEDCNCLIITTLKEDLKEQERDKIIDYIKNGGKLLLMCGPNINNTNLANFQKVLDEYGITLGQGVVFEGSSQNMLSGYPDFIVEEMQEGTSLTKKMNMKMNLCFADAAKIIFNEEKLEELNVEEETLVTTSEKAFIRTNLEGQTSPTRTAQDGEEEECTIAAMATKTIEEGKTSKLIIYANELFAMDMPVQINGYTILTVDLYNNKDLILNSIAYLNEKENAITIRKNIEAVNYTVTEQQNTIIMAIIFALPILIIIAGIIIWQIRRRKK